MAGYSGTPLWKKLGMKEGSRWALVRAPRGFEIEGAPDISLAKGSAAGDLDGLLVFCKDAEQVREAVERAIAQMRRDGGLWIAWPKKSSKLAGDLDFDGVQRSGLAAGLVDNKVCAIDDDWSGLRFVVRKAERKDWPR